MEAFATRARSAPPARGRRRAPWLVAGAAAAAVALVGVVDPAAGPPLCPLRALTGWWCPLCGGTRAVHLALRGDLAASLSANALAPLLVAATVWLWSAWAFPRRVVVPTRAGWILVGATACFGVARNLPWAVALAP